METFKFSVQNETWSFWKSVSINTRLNRWMSPSGKINYNFEDPCILTCNLSLENKLEWANQPKVLQRPQAAQAKDTLC